MKFAPQLALGLASALFACTPVFPQQSQIPGQHTVVPRTMIEDGCTAFAWAPDGRLAFSTRHILVSRKLETQRDDIWILSPSGAKKMIFNGERYSRFGDAFSYTITSLRWSPDGKRLAAQVHTGQLFGDRAGVQPGEMLLLMDSEGKEINPPGARGGVEGAVDGAWLSDAETLAYAAPASRVNPMLSLHILRPGAIRSSPVFAGHTFASLAWYPRNNAAIAVERDASAMGHSRLALLDLVQEDGRALATLPSYQGGLSLSPSAAHVAYFVDQETLEVRDVANSSHSARIHVAFGQIGWAPDDTRIYVRRGEERHDGDLVEFAIPALVENPVDADDREPRLLLGDLLIWRFKISPDGKSVAVSEPGDRKLLLFDLTHESQP